jgi:TRAP-type C4-dicarboxylate transport system substrate-binding protein
MIASRLALSAAVAAVAGWYCFGSSPADAQTITLRIATGHPPAVVYAGQMKDYFQPELKKRVEARTKYKINWVEGYGGSIVKVAETLNGVKDGIIDIGGFCFCFEPANLPLHAFQVMLPFGPVDPIDSLRVAQDVYAQVPYLTKVFEERFNQRLIARITDSSYNLGTNFEWKSLSELKGRRIAGAGLNLNWLRYAGVTPVQS